VELVGPVQCDVLTFRQTVAEDPAAAAAFDPVRFLAGLSVRHSPAFDEWAAATRRELVRRRERALAGLARDAMTKWQWREAAAYAERWLASDQLSDEGMRLLVEALYLAGDRDEALARFAEFRSRLRAETGSEPSRALAHLARKIEADPAGRPERPITDEWYARAPAFECGLIGRDRELSLLQKAWRATVRGAGRIVLIEGEAGVGKSRLALEFLRRLRAEDGAVLQGRGYDAHAGVPFGPVVEALRDALDEPGLAATDPQWLAEATRLLPELRQRFPGLPETTLPPAPAESTRLFEAVAQILAAISAEQPLAVSLDDLQWCDGDSCNLLHFLVRRLAGAPVLWCATVTLGELQRDAPAARLCRVLRAQPGALVLTLAPLSEDQVWQMIRDLGHVSAPTAGRRFARRIHEATAGNPFYALELLKTLFAQGWLTRDPDSGEWLAGAAAAVEARPVTMSPTVHDAIAERIESLPPDLRELLITIAVAGGPCSTTILSHVHGISRLRAASLADELVERRLAVEEDEGGYRCAHPVIGRVVRDGLTGSRRREVHRIIALTLEFLMTSEGVCSPPGEIARHAELGGERAVAYKHAVLASRAALERYAFEEALSWLDLAAATAQPGTESEAVDRLTADVLEVAGWREPPPALRRPEPAVRELEQRDVDLPVQGRGRRRPPP
jgi:hypothetical protein